MTDRKLCGVTYDEGPCRRLAGHKGGHESSVEYRQIKMHPWKEVRDNFADQVGIGAICFQSWTCTKCGAVQRMATSNSFYEVGECENCAHVTNLVISGCNFSLIMPLGPGSREAARKAINDLGYIAPRDN